MQLIPTTTFYLFLNSEILENWVGGTHLEVGDAFGTIFPGLLVLRRVGHFQHALARVGLVDVGAVDREIREFNLRAKEVNPLGELRVTRVHLVTIDDVTPRDVHATGVNDAILGEILVDVLHEVALHPGPMHFLHDAHDLRLLS